MATTRKTTKRPATKAVPAFNVKELAAELGATVKEGRVTAVRDRYYVTIGRAKTEIPVGPYNTVEDIREMTGQTVPAVVSGSAILAVGLPRRGGPCYVTCYIGFRPELIKRIQPQIRAAILEQYVAKGVISEKVAEALRM